MSGWHALITVLAAAVVLLGFGFLALARHVAALATRLPHPRPLELTDGPEIGATLDDWVTPSAVASRFQMQLPTHGLVVFLSTSCSVCYSLAVDLVRFARDHKEESIVVIVSGRTAQLARFRAALAPLEVHDDEAGRMAIALNVGTTPYAVLVRDRQLIAKGVVNDRNMLEALLVGVVRKNGDELLARFAEAQIT